ncbi:MAG: tRNA lysidine(34) synthetase TilS [Candidatus Brocadia sp.]|nr:tRNA lysidine(34) synthetase TilS [Candidatus Brocadia sp.]
MRLDKLPFEVFNTINKYHLIKPHDSIIVAVSGGPDSVALLKILRTINSVKNLHLRLSIAHLNHQLRGISSEEDAQFVRNLSKDLSLPFIFKSVNIQKIADQTKCSIEETARRERYNFFLESAQEYTASTIAIGHTADDNIETLLHRIIRGTGMAGLAGIPIKRPLAAGSTIQLIRPLLFSWRKEIMEYLGKEHDNYRTDATNYEPLYLRNKIRLELIPLLENQYNPNIKNLLMQVCQILNLNNEYLASETKRIVKDSTVEGREDVYTIDTHFLTKQPKILQYLVLREILMSMHIPLKEITYEHYTKILDEIIRKGKGRHFQLPGKLYLWHEHGMLHFTKKSLYKACTPLSEIAVQIPGTTPVYPLGQLVSEILDIQDFSLEAYKKTKTKYEEVFDLQRITMPIFARGRKDGDTISPLGIHGHKKLKDLFIDKKIPVKERDVTPIVVMNNQPIWVIGVCIDNDVKVTPRTKKVLKLTFMRNRKTG